jgi:hypothetical protein
LFLLGKENLVKKWQGKYDNNDQQLYQQYGRTQENRLVSELCRSDSQLCVSRANSISQ